MNHRGQPTEHPQPTDRDPSGPVVDLTVAKSASPDPFVPGGLLTYTVSVTNPAPGGGTTGALPFQVNGQSNPAPTLFTRVAHPSASFAYERWSVLLARFLALTP